MRKHTNPGYSALFLGLLVFFFSFGALMEVPKSTIRLVPDPGFGTGVDWGYYFPTGIDQLIGFLKDGSFYMASSRRSKILLFSPTGEFLSESGRPGQGPGDLTYPSDVSILDGRYVVVKESSETRRISVFNLQGEHFKIIQADNPLISCLALGKGKIAVVTGQLNQNSRKDTVFLKDIHSGQTIPIASFDYEISTRSRIQVPHIHPIVHLARIDQDKLIVGFSEHANLSIYSIEGKAKSWRSSP